MPRQPLALLLAEGVSVDAVSGRVTAFNMLDAITVSGFPVRFARVVVDVIYPVDEKSDQFFERVSLRRPDGSALLSSEIELKLVACTPQQQIATHHSIHAIWNVRFDSPGRYLVTVETSPTQGGSWAPVSSRDLLVAQGLAGPLHASPPSGKADKPAPDVGQEAQAPQAPIPDPKG